MSEETLSALLKEEENRREMTDSLDRAMLNTVLLLRYEQESIEELIENYESLYELRKLIW